MIRWAKKALAYQTGWLEEVLAVQEKRNQIRQMRLETWGRSLLEIYLDWIEWLDMAEALSSPYLRED